MWADFSLFKQQCYGTLLQNMIFTHIKLNEQKKRKVEILYNSLAWVAQFPCSDEKFKLMLSALLFISTLLFAPTIFSSNSIEKKTYHFIRRNENQK